MSLTGVDWIMMAAYSVFALGTGVALKRYIRTSEDFWIGGHSTGAHR